MMPASADAGTGDSNKRTSFRAEMLDKREPAGEWITRVARTGLQCMAKRMVA